MMLWIRFLCFCLLFSCWPAHAEAPVKPDYEREKRWADETLAALVVGDPVWIQQQSNGHKFLGLFTEVDKPGVAVIVAHGRGWSPNYGLYGQLRILLSDAGYSTLSIQMPVLDGTAKLGDYLPVFADGGDRLAQATDWLKKKGYKHVAVVSHSIGASMANHYLVRTPDHKIDAWVFIGIINGLEDMFRIKIPVMDVFGSEDWGPIRHGADERRKQLIKVEGSRQVVVPDARHFFEGKEGELVNAINSFLEVAFQADRKK